MRQFNGVIQQHRQLACFLILLAGISLGLGCQGLGNSRSRVKTRRQLGDDPATGLTLVPSQRAMPPSKTTQTPQRLLRSQSPDESSPPTPLYFEEIPAADIQLNVANEIESDDVSIFEPMAFDPDDQASIIPPESEGFWNRRWHQVRQDYRNLYSRPGFTRLALGFAAGATMAHTNFDRFVTDDLFKENILGASMDEWTEALHEPKIIGDGYVTIPLFAGLSLAEPWLAGHPWGESAATWGNRSFRTILLGGPVLVVSQTLVGGSRPHETSAGSHWTPFTDNNGVSGHSFMGAIPFLTAAHMTENRFVKALWYTGSVLPAISRINDERHYASQAFLGWYLAFVASDMVNRTDRGTKFGTLSPWIAPEGLGVMWEKKF